MDNFEQMNSKKYILNVLLGLLYAIVFDYVYTNFMYNFYSYMYCPDPAPLSQHWLQYLLFSIIPLFFYKGFSTVSSSLSFFVYILMYIPMTYVTYISRIDDVSMQVCLFALLFVMILFFLTDEIILFRNAWLNENQKVRFEMIEIIGLLMFLLILLMEGRSLRFVNILSQSDEMYDLRSMYSQSRNVITGYFMSWLKTAFLPLFVIYYLQTKQWGKYAFALFAYIVMFMLDMQKITFIMPYFITIGFYAVKKTDFLNKFSIFVIGLFSGISSLLVFFSTNSTVFSIAAVFIMRTQCLDAWLYSLYLDFFEHSPFTYYTHINIVNALTNAYPYKQPLGIAVTDGVMNANASFLITDGYAAMGIPGIFFIGFIFVILKSILNGASIKYNRSLLILVMFPAISAMLNVSLFTAVFSFGFLLLYLFFRFVDLSPLEISDIYD